MKDLGIIRKIDSLGRVVIPAELRKTLEMKPHDLFEVYVKNTDEIWLKKHDSQTKGIASIARQIDELGRFVIPIEILSRLGFDRGEELNFFISENNEIMLKKFETGCVFCKDSNEIAKKHMGKLICKTCLDNIK